VRAQGGLLGADDLAAYQLIQRSQLSVPYHDTVVYLNPPPSAGGLLLSHALAELGRTSAPPDVTALVDAMAAAEQARTPSSWPGSAPLTSREQGASGQPRTSPCSTPTAGPAR